MIIRATTLIHATHRLQQRLNNRIDRAQYLNIKYSLAKSELMHLIPFTSGRAINNADSTAFTLYGTQILPTDTLKVLGVRIDKHLCFKVQPARQQ